MVLPRRRPGASELGLLAAAQPAVVAVARAAGDGVVGRDDRGGGEGAPRVPVFSATSVLLKFWVDENLKSLVLL